MAVNKGYANEDCLKLDDNGNYFDTKQKLFKNTEPYYDGLFGVNDLVSKAFVDAEIAKLPKAPSVDDLLKLDGSRAMTGNLDMGDNTITGIKSSAVDNVALTVGGTKATYFPLSGGRVMQGNLNRGKKVLLILNLLLKLTLHNQLKIMKLLTSVISILKEES